MNNDTNGKLCPITLLSEKEMVNKGIRVFRLKVNKNIVQIYNANTLALWLSEHSTYPHMGIPSKEAINELKQLVPSFVMFGQIDPNIDFYGTFMGLNGYTQVHNLANIPIQAFRERIVHIFRKDFSKFNLRGLAIHYNGHIITLGTKHGTFWKADFYSHLQRVLLTKVSINSANVTHIVLKMEQAHNANTMTYDCSFKESSATVNSRSYDKKYQNPSVVGQDIVIYSNVPGELVYDQTSVQNKTKMTRDNIDDYQDFNDLFPPPNTIIMVQPGSLYEPQLFHALNSI